MVSKNSKCSSGHYDERLKSLQGVILKLLVAAASGVLLVGSFEGVESGNSQDKAGLLVTELLVLIAASRKRWVNEKFNRAVIQEHGSVTNLHPLLVGIVLALGSPENNGGTRLGVTTLNIKDEVGIAETNAELAAFGEAVVTHGKKCMEVVVEEEGKGI